MSVINCSLYDDVWQEVAAECASMQKQADVLQLAEQSQDDMAVWLGDLLQQLKQAVSSTPESTELHKLITRYQVHHLFCILSSVINQLCSQCNYW